VIDTPVPAAAALPPDYPADLERVWRAADGTVVTFRALRPDDIDQELAFIAGLSEETLHLRLQYSSRGVSREDAMRLLQLDYRDTLAVGALIREETGDRLIGVSRYARQPGTDRAECAVVVADGWQGRGIGTELMRGLALAARSRGIRALAGTILAENRRILDLAQRFGPVTRSEPSSAGVVEVTIDLEQPAAPS
jgi:acetyltransferase